MEYTDEKGQLLGLSYEYFEGNHGDNTVYLLNDEQVPAFWTYKLKNFREYLSQLSFKLKKLSELSDRDRKQLMKLCKVPKEDKGDYYVIEFTDLQTGAQFFEEDHRLQYYLI